MAVADRRVRGRHLMTAAWALTGALAVIPGCGTDTTPDPTLKTEQGKSIQESTAKGRGGAAPKAEAAPIQRTTRGLE